MQYNDIFGILVLSQQGFFRKNLIKNNEQSEYIFINPAHNLTNDITYKFFKREEY